MKILLINKFLHPNGGLLTIFKLGECLQNMGHEVQYFGMDHKNRCVGNAVNSLTIYFKYGLSLCEYIRKDKVSN